MSLSRLRRALASCALAVVLPLSAAAPALADNVVPDDQIVQGNLCVGVLCVNGEVFGSPALRVETDDTPTVDLVQTSGRFRAQTWDLAGNEQGFVVRDVTAGSHVPFRIRPGAPTDSFTIDTTGTVTSRGMLTQLVFPSELTVGAPVDGAAVLSALRTLAISRYRFNSDTAGTPHVGPAGADFGAAFGLDGGVGAIAPTDMAAVALAAVQALDARVSAIGLTPGPQGASGTPGAQGPAGAAADLTAANRQIGALQRSNRRLARSVKTLQRQMRTLLARR
ncbi:MAG TPA: hypothetical protein VKB25_11025 [Conexibacter sp.]|nr:hypothetical protein [Conexibacter sp.]